MLMIALLAAAGRRRAESRKRREMQLRLARRLQASYLRWSNVVEGRAPGEPDEDYGGEPA
jgi:hypothetical protein